MGTEHSHQMPGLSQQQCCLQNTNCAIKLLRYKIQPLCSYYFNNNAIQNTVNPDYKQIKTNDKNYSKTEDFK